MKGNKKNNYIYLSNKHHEQESSSSNNKKEPKENVKQLNLACTCIIYICTIEIGRRIKRLDGGKIKKPSI